MECVDRRLDHFDSFCQLPSIGKTSKVLKNSTFFYSSLHVFGKVSGIKASNKMLILGLFHYSPIPLIMFFFWKVLVSLPSYISLKQKLCEYTKRDRKNSHDESSKKASFFRELWPVGLVESGCITGSQGWWMMGELSQNQEISLQGSPVLPAGLLETSDVDTISCVSGSSRHIWLVSQNLLILWHTGFSKHGVPY